MPVLPVVAPGAPLARRNPVAKLLAATVLAVALAVVVDPVTPSLVLAVELAVVPLTGVRPFVLLRRSWPLLLAAGGIALTTLLVGTDRSGATVVAVGPLLVTSGSLLSAGGLAVRLVAIALPGLLVVASTDATDLADSLVQQARVPARFAVGALAAFRLLPLLADEWRTIALARRARGVDAGRNPVAALGLFGGQVFTLLVGAIRRGVRLAAAMDARGFDSGRLRTIARPQVVRPADRLLVLAAVLVAVGATGVSVALGTWQPLLR